MTEARGLLNLYILEDIDLLGKQTGVYAKDYYSYRSEGALGKLPTMKYIENNSFGASPEGIKNNNFIKV